MPLSVIAFNRGVPPPESFPREQLADCARHVLSSQGDLILQYGDPAGYQPLREWVANQYHTQHSQVILGQGSLQLLDHLVHACLQPDDLVFVEQPTYDRTLTIFRRAGIHLMGFQLKSGILDLDEVEDALHNGQVPKFFYIIPDFQNPSGALMPLEQRQRLIQLASDFDFMLIEDGPYRHLRYEGKSIPSLFEINPLHVVHMSSFSKLISPGMRVGIMVGREDMIRLVAKHAQDTYISPSCLDQAVAYEFIQRGWMDEHLTALIALYQPRLTTMLGALEDNLSNVSSWIVPQGGFFVGVNLDPFIHKPAMSTAEKAGIMLSDSRNFFLDGGDHFIRLPFCALNQKQIVSGIERLNGILLEK